MKFKVLAAALIAAFLCTQVSAAPSLKKQLKKMKEQSEPKKKKEKEKVQRKEPVVKYDLEMNDNIDLEQAVMALLPKNSTLVHPITQGVYGPADGSIGANINVIYSTDNKIPQIMVLTPVKAGKYNKTKTEILNFGTKTGVDVVSVFYNQIDKDAPRELLILCSVSGKDGEGYKTAVFDWQKTAFKRVPGLESKLADQYPAINVRRTLHEVLAQ